MNDLASPPRPWDMPKEPRTRVLFANEIPKDHPHNNDWTSEPY